jgi:NAD-dependent deacetylase
MQEQLNALNEHLQGRRLRRITVLTGAGISAESGVPTFRGPGGLWENHRPEELATPEAFARDPELVWRWYAWRQGIVHGARPNRAHEALAEFEKNQSERIGLTIVTQNVDGLHARAGSENLLELHGNMFRTRCMREGRIETLTEPVATIPPHCKCGAMLRPDVVWFGETIDLIGPAMQLASQSDLLLIVGTSGVVYPAAGLIDLVRSGLTVEINPEDTPLSDRVDVSIRSSASDAVPLVLDLLAGVLR